jgi:16S rRNA (cytidine1402-2'-O)-methyltransferase
MQEKKLFLLPNFISSDNDVSWLCPLEIQCLHKVKYFITESRSALFSLLKKTNYPDLSNVEWDEFNEHCSSPSDSIMEWLKKGYNLGLVSDAGLPSIADPGYHIVRIAHQNNYTVSPLPGPGSVYMAIMASGLNSQSFVFHGYLPRDEKKLVEKIKEIKSHIYHTSYSHFFIETPYRNLRLAEIILKNMPDEWNLLLAGDISGKNETIKLKNIAFWKKNELSFLNKRPFVWGIGI